MSEATRYLDGFLAAAFPGNRRADTEPPALAARSDPLPPPASVPPAEAALPEEEKIKRHLHPLDSFPRLLECVSTNLPPAPDDQFRFQWFGLFYQAPRQDAFLLRLRLPGGRVGASQLLELAEVIQTCAGGQILPNAQGGVDIPSVPLRMAADILRRVENIGLSARQTGGDCVQSVRGGEHEGLADPGLQPGPVYTLVCALEQSLAHSRRLADLPCGCEIVFQSADEHLVTDPDRLPDTLVLRAFPPGIVSPSHGSDPDREACFLLVVPGEPEGGWRLPASRVVPGCLQLLEAWAADADRTRRQNAGLAAYCRTLGREGMSALLDKAEWQPMPRSPRIGSVLPEAAVLPGFSLPVPGGRLLSGQLRQIGQILREHHLAQVRLVRGNLLLPAVADARVSDALRLALGTQ